MHTVFFSVEQNAGKWVIRVCFKLTTTKCYNYFIHVGTFSIAVEVHYFWPGIGRIPNWQM
jgi:ABC-type antimicrobial peptide transport system permease subunit